MAGGNWNALAAWDEGAVPTAADEIVARPDGTSGNLVFNIIGYCRSLDLTNYVGVITATNMITIGDATAPTGMIALKLAGTINYAGNAGFTFISSAAGIHTIDSNGISQNEIVINGTAYFQFISDVPLCKSVAIYQGTLDTNGYDINNIAGNLAFTGGSAKTLTLGDSILTMGGTTQPITVATVMPTITANTGTIRFNGVAVNINPYADGLDLNGCTLEVYGTVGTVTFSKSISFGCLRLNPTTTKTISIVAGKTLTITNKIYCYPIAGQVTFTGGTISIASGTFNLYNVADSTTVFQGGATFNLRNNCDVTAAHALAQGLTILGGNSFVDYVNGSDTLYYAYGFHKVAYTGAVGTCPPLGDVCVGETSASTAKVSFVNEYEWSLGAGTIWFESKSAAFVGETIRNSAHDGHFTIAADFVYGSWKTLTTGAAVARIAPKDIIRIAKSPAPVKLSGATGQATWTSLSKTVTLAEAQIQNIDMCESVWTANAGGDAVGAGSVTATGVATTAKEGSFCMKILLDAAVQANIMQAYFATGALNLSTKQQISFWIQNSGAIVDNNWLIALCSDVAGAVPVDMFQIPAITPVSTWLPLTLSRAYSVAFTGGSGAAPAAGTTLTGATSLSTAIVIRSTLSGGTWAGGDAAGVMFVYSRSAAFVSEQVDQGANHFHITTDFAQGNLGSAIASIAVYSGNVTTGMASKYIYVDDFIACVSGGLNLQSLISKNAVEQSSDATVNKSEGWYGIQSINGLTVLLDNGTSTKANTGKGYYTTGTSPETVDTYIRETIKTVMVAVSASSQSLSQGGNETVGNIEFQAGYDIILGTQIGETFYDGLNGFGYGLNVSQISYVILNHLSFVRYDYGINTLTTSNNIIFSSISDINNCTSNGFYLGTGSFNITITLIINCNNNTIGFIASGGSLGNTVKQNLISSIININNNLTTGFSFNQYNCANIITNITNLCNSSYGIRFGDWGHSNYVSNIENISNNATIGIEFNGGNNNRIGTVTNVINTLTGTGILFSDTCFNRIDSVANCNANLIGFEFRDTACFNFIGNITTTGNTTLGKGIRGKNFINHATFAESISLITSAEEWSNTRININKLTSTGYSYIYTDYGNIVSQAATAGGTGIEWKFSITNVARTSNYPLDMVIARIACNAGSEVSVKAYFKKSSGSDIGAKLVCRAGQIAGVTTDVVTTCPLDTVRNQLEIKFTPSEVGVVEIEAWAYWLAGLADENVIVDGTISVTQA